jgi:hypothetical protein
MGEPSKDRAKELLRHAMLAPEEVPSRVSLINRAAAVLNVSYPAKNQLISVMVPMSLRECSAFCDMVRAVAQAHDNPSPLLDNLCLLAQMPMHIWEARAAHERSLRDAGRNVPLRRERLLETTARTLLLHDSRGQQPRRPFIRPHTVPVTPQMTYAMEPPEEYCCGISMELMDNPVLLPNGWTCDRKNIERWLRIHPTNPTTGMPLCAGDLRSREDLKRDIDAWKAEQEFRAIELRIASQ